MTLDILLVQCQLVSTSGSCSLLWSFIPSTTAPP